MCVLGLSGDAVSLAASEDLLLCVTQAPGPCQAEPNLEYALYGVSAKERLAAGSLPLSPSATLRWIGFSAEALPLALDSAGTLRALALSSGAPSLAPGEWLPVASLPEGGSGLWPVRAEDGALHCAELTKTGRPTQKLQPVRYCLPLGVETQAAERVLRQNFLSEHLRFALEAHILPTPARHIANKVARQRRERGGEGRLVSKLFDSLAKAGDVEQALEVARHFFGCVAIAASSSEGAKQLQEQLLEEAEAYCIGIGQDALTERISQLRQTPSVEEAANKAITGGDLHADGKGDPREDGHTKPATVRPREEVFADEPPASRLRTC